MHRVFASQEELQTALQTIVTFSPPSVTIHDKTALTASGIDTIVYNAVFAPDPLSSFCRSLIYALADSLEIRSASIRPLYTAFGTGEVSGFTVPAINIRTLTYDTARLIFQIMREKRIGPVVFEIARSEIEYTHQRPQEYATVVLAAAIKEGYQGPVFLQGDHYQLSKRKFEAERDTEVDRIKHLIQESIAARFFNIDIDASTLVDLTKSDLHEQQKLNSEITALLTIYISQLQPRGVDISIGGEIGHIGGKNSTPKEFEAFMDNYRKEIVTGGITKVSVQTGTSHGGIPLPDGTMQQVSLDFRVLKAISALAREIYHIGGAVQHGASTLPLAYFDRFVENETLEIHLATGFQNIVYETMPQDLRQEIYSWIQETHANEQEEGQTSEQFLYKTRKKALGPFKQVLWDLSEEEKSPIRDRLSRQLLTIFEKLHVFDTRHVIDAYVQ